MKEEPLYAHNDPKSWGKQFVMAAGRVGRKAVLFNRPEEVPSGSRVFVRLDQEASQRQQTKDIVAQLSVRNCITLPTMNESVLYDDKIQQYFALKEWMPETYISFLEPEARHFINNGSLRYPFLSKTLDGSASKGVRIINNRIEAFTDLDLCFNKGRTSVYDRIQKGYVYWQEFLPDNDFDYRVCVNHNYVYGLIRYNRSKSEPFASGSGNNKPLILKQYETKDRAAHVVELAVKISRQIKTDWMAYDFVYNKYGAPKVLEMSSSWTPHAYATCPVYSFMSDNMFFEEKGLFGGHMFDFAVKALEKK